MGTLIELFITLLIVLGSLFLLVGSIGLIKLRELMTRLHAPTKATTLGIGSILFASMIHFVAIEQTPSIHEVLIILFLFLTAPVTAHFIAKAHLHQHMRDGADLPSTERDYGWSTFDPGPGARDRGATEDADGPELDER